jgi:hypothetical protein
VVIDNEEPQRSIWFWFWHFVISMIARRNNCTILLVRAGGRVFAFWATGSQVRARRAAPAT